MQTQKISLGMWITIASTAVGILGVVYSMYTSNVKKLERQAKLEGTVEQLVKTVDNLEHVLLDQGRRLSRNTERITTTEKVASEARRELPKLKRVVQAHGEQIASVTQELAPKAVTPTQPEKKDSPNDPQ